LGRASRFGSRRSTTSGSSPTVSPTSRSAAEHHSSAPPGR
jgi:hypothetical protein